MPVILDAYVETVENDTFEAVFITPEGKQIWASMSAEQVPEQDRDLIQPGAYFKWTLEDSGVAVISFLREYFTKEEIEQAQERASTLLDGIKWADNA